ncbi:transposase [Nocardia fusca]|uniref:transposase n=1 Tax=Nocardia fusca TaxID=941183 RepID=UPI0037C6F4F7
MAISSTPAGSIRAIGRHLDVAASTISRELGRHRVETGRGRGASRETRYHAGVAHHRTMRSRVRTRARKLDCNELRSLVVSSLNEKHSPQQVAGRQRMMFPNQPELWVSHEIIYQALYVQGRGSLRHELTVAKALRSGRSRRQPASRLPSRDVRPWLAGARITDREPPRVWCSPSFLGRMGRSCLRSTTKRPRPRLSGWSSITVTTTTASGPR